MLGGDARAILKGEAEVDLIVPKHVETPARRARKSAAPDPGDDPLFAALRALRREIAQEAGVPPYVVFHDSTLREMAAEKPQTLFALAEISGVGARKRDAYGARFVEAIRSFSSG